MSDSFDDSRNEALANKRISAASSALKDAHINVTSFQGIMLITGQVPSAELIQMATAEAKSLRNVRVVHNELVVAGATSALSRVNDSWLTTRAYTAMSVSDKTDATRIKIVTENGIVYLMGLLTRTEADAAVEISRSIRGVQKIVKVFEYIN